MKVKELIELLKEQPQDAELLIDSRQIHDVDFTQEGDDGYYLDDTPIEVVNMYT